MRKTLFLNYIGRRKSVLLIQRIGKRISNGIVYHLVCAEVSVKKTMELITEQIYQDKKISP